jgi:hypothetical protein
MTECKETPCAHIPETLQEAVETLVTAWRKHEGTMKLLDTLTETQFLGRTHHFLGQNIRNDWELWWTPELAGKDGWSETPNKLVQQLAGMGLWHGDDRSGIILTTAYRHFHGKDLDLDGQVKHYLDFWAKQGFGPNGVKKQ